MKRNLCLLRILPFTAFVLSVLTVLASRSSHAADSTIAVNGTEQLQQAVASAKPGTKILIAPGRYRGGLHFQRLQGTKEQPIIIQAEDSRRPPVLEGGGSGLHFTDPAWLELHDLVIEKARGNGLNIDDGGSYDSPAHHLLLNNLTIRDIGPDGNRDGIKLSGVDEFRIENCTLERWGSGGSAIDMVGCHKGTITNCNFRYRDRIAANGVQTKGGSREITIRHCRFEHCGNRAVNIGGSTGLQFFRPKPAGYEAAEITVEDCTFIGSMAPVAYVGVDGAVVRHNVIYRPTGWVLRILQENRSAEFVPSRKGRFENNIIVFRSDELRTLVNIGGGTAPQTFQFAENVWFCIDRPQATERIVRSLPTKETNGLYGRDPQFEDAERGDFRLKQSSPARKAGVRAVGDE